MYSFRRARERRWFSRMRIVEAELVGGGAGAGVADWAIEMVCYGIGLMRVGVCIYIYIRRCMKVERDCEIELI